MMLVNKPMAPITSTPRINGYQTTSKMRVFKSLEANIGPMCLANEEKYTHPDDTFLTRHDVSSSLPNLTCDPFDKNPTNEDKGISEPKISQHENDSYEVNGKNIHTTECDEGQLGVNLDLKDFHYSTDFDDTDRTLRPQSEQASNSFENSESKLSTSLDDLYELNACQNHLDTKSLTSYKSITSTKTTDVLLKPDDAHSIDANDEKCDELGLLKRSPRNSPGNTLDSGICSLGRADSFGKTDVSSYSSVSSVSTGIEGAVNDDETSIDTNEDLCDIQECDQPQASTQPDSSEVNNDVKPKQKTGFGSFLSRGLFSRKSKEEDSSNSSQFGWRIFGGGSSGGSCSKGDLKSVPLDEPKTETNDAASLCSVTSSDIVDGDSGKAMKKTDIEVLSTTALILEQRPSGLPCKDPEEEQKHRAQYQQMVDAARKKELKDCKQRKKQIQQQLRHEESMANAAKIWNTEILTAWGTMHTTKKARDLWWYGIPPSVRGKVWKLAFGNDLNLTKDLYHICLNRAKERLKLIEDWCGDTDSICSHMSGFSDHSASREASVELIKLDVSRTFPQLCIFQKGGPYHELLQGLLGAYACYRPDVGYVQGMSFIAAVLLLNMEVQDAFICFANLLNRPCQIAFFRLDECLMKAYFDTYEELFEENLPELYSHFKQLNISSDLYIIDWMFTLYAKSLPLDIASRVWDMFARDGEEFLFRTALGILKMYEDILLSMDFIHLAQFLTRLPENIQSEELFAYIERIKMQKEALRFKELLSHNRDLIRETGSLSSYS